MHQRNHLDEQTKVRFHPSLQGLHLTNHHHLNLGNRSGQGQNILYGRGNDQARNHLCCLQTHHYLNQSIDWILTGKRLLRCL